MKKVVSGSVLTSVLLLAMATAAHASTTTSTQTMGRSLLLPEEVRGIGADFGIIDAVGNRYDGQLRQAMALLRDRF